MNDRLQFDDTFAEQFLTEACASPEFPRTYYSHDGDYLELITCQDSYSAVRIDDLLTMYVSRESKKPIGAMLKNVRRFIDEVRERQPGSRVDFSGRNVQVEYLLTAYLWARDPKGDSDVLELCIKLREAARVGNLQVNLNECGAC